MKENKNSEKRNNFIRISENRVNKIIILFNQLKNLKNKSFYEYDEEDINKIFLMLEKEMNDTKESLLNDDKKGKRFEL